MADLIDRQTAIETVHKVMYEFFDLRDDDEESPLTEKDNALLAINKKLTNRIKELPSAQQWHEIHKTPMTEDERKEWSERLGYDIEYEGAYFYSNLPDDGQEVLVSTQYGRVYVDTFCQDEGCYFEANGDMDGILAWMPLPAPFKGNRTD